MEYMRTILSRSVVPDAESVEKLSIFQEPLNDGYGDMHEIIERLHRYGSPATVAQTGGRYFGFVNGGIIPASLAAKWLTDVWDQNTALYVMSPVVSVLEGVCEKWLAELFGFPSDTAAGFVAGSSSAMLCGLAAGRNRLLGQAGYDAGEKGLFGAPEIRVVLGEGAHSSVYKALSILGLGSGRVTRVPQDEQGRIRTDAVPALDDRTLLILQAGNVNTGSFDHFDELCLKARDAGAWVHIDGAFGLWAAASEKLKYLTRGIEHAHSWSLYAHKSLNAPYDCGIIMCSDRTALANALHMTGSYLVFSEQRDNMLYTIDMSRRARAVELWASLKSLGKRGVAELMEDLHDKAVYFAKELSGNGFVIHNDVVFNQVIVSPQDPSITEQTLQNIQNSGVCWCGGSKWENKPVIRISVCSYRTTYQDIDLSVKAFVEAKKLAESTAGSVIPKQSPAG